MVSRYTMIWFEWIKTESALWLLRNQSQRSIYKEIERESLHTHQTESERE